MSMDYPAFFDDILSRFFEHQSMEESIQLLADSLNRHIPFTKLTCYAGDSINRQFYPIVVYESSSVNPQPVPHFFDFPPVEWTRAHTVDKEFSILIEDDISPVGAQLSNMFDERRSLLGMTLFTSKYYSITMTLTSPEPSQFTQAHVQLLKILQHPLARLALSFFRSQSTTPLHLTSEQQEQLSSLDLLKRCRGLRHAVRLLEGVAPTDISVLLQGETGVGKELFADALHELSARKNAPFIRVNCAAITPSLLDDAFFGHEKGAFTGAGATHLGYFEQANGGTLFLDEIGELSLNGQARLLRILESKELMRVGGQRRILVNVRLVAATHRNLEAMAQEGAFREDLWYRLAVFPIAIPPLRQRKEDIPVLANWFHSMGVKQLNRSPEPELTEEYIGSLLHMGWPGNVRQLRHYIDQCIIRASITGSNVMKSLSASGAIVPETAAADAQPGKEEAAPQLAQTPPKETLDTLAARHIAEALEQCRGRIQGPFGAAALLGVNASTLRSRMKKLGIRRPR